MGRRIPRANEREYWSDRDQGLHRKWEEPERDDDAALEDPTDYSAIGGPESERSYGRSRSDTGNYPFGRDEGPADRDDRIENRQRGGYMKLHGSANAGYRRQATGDSQNGLQSSSR